MKPWLKIALEQKVISRAVKYAIIVGAVLILINHGDSIMRGDVTPVRLFKIGLTIMVPYIVSTCSSVGAIMEAGGREHD
jgi:hypothetical protein